MKLCLTLTLSIVLALNLKAQTTDSLEKIADKIVEEATKMYQSEMTSWYGTDLLMKEFNDKTTLLGGYASYREGVKDKCIFYSKGEKPKVLLTVAFKNDEYSLQKAIAYDEERELTPIELDYFNIRQAAVKLIASDTFFTTYKNTSLNLIPIIDSISRRVYILTAPQNKGILLFGNDYELIFDKNNVLKSKKKLHDNLFSLNFAQDRTEIGEMHTHSNNEFMTATDVCTLMLYGKKSGWVFHLTMSEKYVSVWTILQHKLGIFKKEVWEKMVAEKEKKPKKKK